MAQIFKAPKKSRAKHNKAKVNKHLELTIDSLDHKGIGVSRYEGQVIFVDGALPGEKCDVSITDEKNRFLQGRVNKVITASQQRQEPFCPHFTDCGGCQTQYAQPAAMLNYKQQAVNYLLAKKLSKNGRDALPWQQPMQEEDRGYRRKTRLSVDARNRNNIVLGFRRNQSKQIIAVQQCNVLETELQVLITPIHQLLTSMSTPSAITHVNLIKGDNLVMVCFRHTKSLGSQDRASLKAFGQDNECQVVLEGNGEDFEQLTEQGKNIHYLADSEIKVEFGPNDFIQVNNNINQHMIQQAIDWLEVGESDVVLDLFCGVGNFSLPMARLSQSVIGIEGVAKMVQQATKNAQLNGIDNVQFYHADLNDEKVFVGEQFSTVNKVLLDPAREGASGIIGLLKSIAASHILYVSCNPSTFTRDAEHILQQDFRLEKIGLMDMFPNTAHTELMALFVRR